MTVTDKCYSKITCEALRQVRFYSSRGEHEENRLLALAWQRLAMNPQLIVEGSNSNSLFPIKSGAQLEQERIIQIERGL